MGEKQDRLGLGIAAGSTATRLPSLGLPGAGTRWRSPSRNPAALSRAAIRSAAACSSLPTGWCWFPPAPCRSRERPFRQPAVRRRRCKRQRSRCDAELTQGHPMSPEAGAFAVSAPSTRNPRTGKTAPSRRRRGWGGGGGGAEQAGVEGAEARRRQHLLAAQIGEVEDVHRALAVGGNVGGMDRDLASRRAPGRGRSAGARSRALISTTV
jgi:hypothetical protein